MAERDRRRERYPYWLSWNIEWHGGRGSFEFQTDVWAARTILEKQFGRGSVTAGRVTRWMASHGFGHGYKSNSLRAMIYRAFEAIEILETYPRGRGGRPHWPAFDLDD